MRRRKKNEEPRTSPFGKTVLEPRKRHEYCEYCRWRYTDKKGVSRCKKGFTEGMRNHAVVHIGDTACDRFREVAYRGRMADGRILTVKCAGNIGRSRAKDRE